MAGALGRHRLIRVEVEGRRGVHEHAGAGEGRAPDADVRVIVERLRLASVGELANEDGLVVPPGLLDLAHHRGRQRMHIVGLLAVEVPLDEIVDGADVPRPLVTGADVPLQADRPGGDQVAVDIERLPNGGHLLRPRDPHRLGDGAVPLGLVEQIDGQEVRRPAPARRDVAQLLRLERAHVGAREEVVRRGQRPAARAAVGIVLPALPRLVGRKADGPHTEDDVEVVGGGRGQDAIVERGCHRREAAGRGLEAALLHAVGRLFVLAVDDHEQAQRVHAGLVHRREVLLDRLVLPVPARIVDVGSDSRRAGRRACRRRR